MLKVTRAASVNAGMHTQVCLTPRQDGHCLARGVLPGIWATQQQ